MGLPLLLTLLLGTGACIDDPASLRDDPIPITPEEAEFLGLGLWRQSVEARLAVDDEVPQGIPGPAGVPVPFSAADSTSVPCALGGDIAVVASISGSVDEEAGVADITFTLVQTHESCRDGEGEDTYTLFGAPDVTTTFAIGLVASGEVILSGAIDGGIVAFTAGRSLLCEIDISFSGVERTDGSTSASVRGTVCGVAIDESVDEPAG